ncbi:hypothetical protein GIB67_027562, partial [Kingdonia uniflora]
ILPPAIPLFSKISNLVHLIHPSSSSPIPFVDTIVSFVFFVPSPIKISLMMNE